MIDKSEFGNNRSDKGVGGNETYKQKEKYFGNHSMLFSNVASYCLCKYIWKRFWTLVRNVYLLAPFHYLNPLYPKSRKETAFLYRIKANLFQKYF